MSGCPGGTSSKFAPRSIASHSSSTSARVERPENQLVSAAWYLTRLASHARLSSPSSPLPRSGAGGARRCAGQRTSALSSRGGAILSGARLPRRGESARIARRQQCHHYHQLRQKDPPKNTATTHSAPHAYPTTQNSNAAAKVVKYRRLQVTGEVPRSVGLDGTLPPIRRQPAPFRRLQVCTVKHLAEDRPPQGGRCGFEGVL